MWFWNRAFDTRVKSWWGAFNSSDCSGCHQKTRLSKGKWIMQILAFLLCVDICFETSCTETIWRELTVCLFASLLWHDQHVCLGPKKFDRHKGASDKLPSLDAGPCEDIYLGEQSRVRWVEETLVTLLIFSLLIKYDPQCRWSIHNLQNEYNMSIPWEDRTQFDN